MAARHANPGIRLRASALRRCPRGCDKLGHFPGGPDSPGQTTAAFADSEGLGKSHRAGGRACLGPQVGLQTQQRPNLVHERLYPCAARGSDPRRPASGPPAPPPPPTQLRRLPPRPRRKCVSLGGGSRRRRVRPPRSRPGQGPSARGQGRQHYWLQKRRAESPDAGGRWGREET